MAHSDRALSPEDYDRLKREQAAHIITEIWPKTPHPSLRRRTPLQAGQAGDSETFLRASIRRMEAAYDAPEEVLDWNELRSKLHLDPEPAIDPAYGGNRSSFTFPDCRWCPSTGWTTTAWWRFIAAR